MSEKKIEYEQCDCCGWKESPIVDIDDFGKSCCFNCFINYNPKVKKEYDNQLKKAQQDLIRKIEKMLFRISGYKSEINSFVNIGRQNCMNDIDNELMEIKRDLK